MCVWAGVRARCEPSVPCEVLYEHCDTHHSAASAAMCGIKGCSRKPQPARSPRTPKFSPELKPMLRCRGLWTTCPAKPPGAPGTRQEGSLLVATTWLCCILCQTVLEYKAILMPECIMLNHTVGYFIILNILYHTIWYDLITLYHMISY